MNVFVSSNNVLLTIWLFAKQASHAITLSEWVAKCLLNENHCNFHDRYKKLISISNWTLKDSNQIIQYSQHSHIMPPSSFVSKLAALSQCLSELGDPVFFNVYRRNVFQCSQQGAASPAGSSFSRLAGAPPGSEMEKVFIFTSGIKVVWGEFQGHFKFHFPKVNWWFFLPQKFQLTWF